jgi:hypothetical protein
MRPSAIEGTSSGLDGGTQATKLSLLPKELTVVLEPTTWPLAFTARAWLELPPGSVPRFLGA